MQWVPHVWGVDISRVPWLTYWTSVALEDNAQVPVLDVCNIAVVVCSSHHVPKPIRQVNMYFCGTVLISYKSHRE